ncbi:MAG: DUF998 domain-containing protein [Candidatus Kariarchaeaceae archaeon]
MRGVQTELQYKQIQRGKYYGYGVLASFFLLLPIASLLSQDYTQDKQMSDLGVDPKSALIFNIMVVFAGYCLYQYHSLYLRNQVNPSKFRYWSMIITLGQIAGIGTIGMGLIPYYKWLKEPHTWMAVGFFGGMSLSILLYSIDLYRNKSRKNLALFGFLIFIYALLYPMYFRYTSTKGYWQKAYALILILWHILLHQGDLE